MSNNLTKHIGQILVMMFVRVLIICYYGMVYCCQLTCPSWGADFCLSQMKIFKDWKNWRYQRISFKWVCWTEFLFIRAFACSIIMNHNTRRWIKQQSPLYHILMHGMMKLTNKSCLLFAKCANAQSALTLLLLHGGKERKQQKGN